jgi:hypothetical protein
MTSATLARRRCVQPGNLLTPAPRRRWIGAVVGLLIGAAVVCHGCHVGDRDDELSLTGGKTRIESRKEKAATGPERERED